MFNASRRIAMLPSPVVGTPRVGNITIHVACVYIVSGKQYNLKDICEFFHTNIFSDNPRVLPTIDSTKAIKRFKSKTSQLVTYGQKCKITFAVLNLYGILLSIKLTVYIAVCPTGSTVLPFYEAFRRIAF